MVYKTLDKNIKLASEIILSGGIIIYPTDTIYGFGVDATNPIAINKLNKLKKRISPLSIIVSSFEMIEEFVDLNFIVSDELKNINVMGFIEDNHRKRKHKDTESVLGNFGDRKQNTNKVDFDDSTIKEQENKE